jgi:hypothetical protein
MDLVRKRSRQMGPWDGLMSGIAFSRTTTREYDSVMKSQTLPSADRLALDRLLDPLARRLTPASARALVEFRADPGTLPRIAELAEKCNEGELTASERVEYEAYVRAGDLITVLQSKARRLLRSRKS